VAVAADWLTELERLWMPRDPIQPSEALRAWLTYRYDVAKRVGARGIVEIGVRAGYSAFAMLSARPDARFLGIDARTKDYAYMDFEGHSRQLLRQFPHVEIMHKDSRSIRTLPRAELIHIDGDHSYAGCMADLKLAVRSGIGWALVDDTTFIPRVCQAVKRFASDHGLAVEWFEDGVRGSALLRLE
jgi:hypothetical protein